MQREFTRDEIEAATKLIASLYCANREILPKDDKFYLCHANRILEELAKKYPYKAAVSVSDIEIDIDPLGTYGSWGCGNIISDLQEQNEIWGPSGSHEVAKTKKG